MNDHLGARYVNAHTSALSRAIALLALWITAVFLSGCSTAGHQISVVPAVKHISQACPTSQLSGQRNVQSVPGCDDTSTLPFDTPVNSADPSIGIYLPPSPDAPKPLNLPPLGQGGTPFGTPAVPNPFVDAGPFSGQWVPVFTFDNTSISFRSGPSRDTIGVIAPDAITDISLGVSTAGTPIIPTIPTMGHLYVQFWASGNPIGRPIQAGWVRGKLMPADFDQQPISQPHVFLQRTPLQLSLLSAKITRAVTRYIQNAAIAPAYDPLYMNSNSFADGVLLAVGIPQSEIVNMVQALYVQSGLNEYAYLNGTQLQFMFN